MSKFYVKMTGSLNHYLRCGGVGPGCDVDNNHSAGATAEFSRSAEGKFCHEASVIEDVP
jgi:hypothetical protein